jgi:acetylornithine deacetylase/succinyl-diaminopimelate desuccinylase-like protein
MFGSGCFSLSEGGSIPIIAILGKEFANAQIIVTGVLGPNSNAHGPNECISLSYTLKFTQGMAQILAHAALHFAA